MNIQIEIFTAIVSFFFGIIVGFYGRTLFFPQELPNSNQFLLIIVAIVWAISVIVSLVNPSVQVPAYVNALFGALFGFFFNPINKIGGGTSP